MSKKAIKKQTTKQPLRKDPSGKILPANHESQQQKANRQKQLVENLNKENVQRYLKQLQKKNKKDQIVTTVTESAVSKVASILSAGILQIPEVPPPLPLDKPQTKMTSEEAKAIQIKIKKQQVQRKIDYLYDQIKGDNISIKKHKKQPSIQIKQVLSKEQHEKKIREILQQKNERKRRIQEITSQKQRIQIQNLQRQKQLKKIQQQKQKELKRQQIKKRMQKNKKQHQIFLQIQQKSKQTYKKVKQMPHLYQKMQQKYKSQIQLPFLQQKKNKLKQLRNFHKIYDVSSIKTHQKEYLTQIVNRSRSNQKPNKTSLQNNRYNPPKRSQRLSKFLSQQQNQIKQQLQQRNKRIQDMQKRYQQFNMVLKKHKPKIDTQKKNEVLMRLQQQRKKHQKIDIDSRKIGQQYMQMARKLIKSGSIQQKTQQKPQSQRSNSSQPLISLSLSRASKHTDEFYQNIRKKRLQGIIHSQQKSINQKYLMLKMQADKLNQKFKQKQSLAKCKGQQFNPESADILLSSIQAKMGIMDILKKNINN